VEKSHSCFLLSPLRKRFEALHCLFDLVGIYLALVQSASKKQSEEVVFSDLFIYLFVCLLDFPQVVGTDFRETFQRVGCLWP